MSYDYHAKGRADFEAGRKDATLYAHPGQHGADYRYGWQMARRAQELLDTGVTYTPNPELKPAKTGQKQGSAAITEQTACEIKPPTTPPKARKAKSAPTADQFDFFT